MICHLNFLNADQTGNLTDTFLLSSSSWRSIVVSMTLRDLKKSLRLPAPKLPSCALSGIIFQPMDHPLWRMPAPYSSSSLPFHMVLMIVFSRKFVKKQIRYGSRTLQTATDFTTNASPMTTSTAPARTTILFQVNVDIFHS